MFPLHSQIKNETTAMNWYKRLTLYSAALASVLLPGACSDEGPLDDAIPASGDAISFGIVSGRSSRAADASGAQSAAGSGTQSAAAPAAQPDDRFVLRSSETADSLCVRTAVSDFPASAADTRATLVTAADFYTAFHVLAHWKANGTWVDSFFYMDVDVNKSGGVWGTAADDPYYWPGAQHVLKFYAYAPADAPFTKKPAKPSDGLKLEYTVDPANAASQRDLVVATPAETPGDYNQPQELQFRHICTAVRFVMGSDLQPGKFTKVELTGVQNNGTYDLETGKWTLDATTGNFAQSFAEGSATTDGTTPSGTAITPDGEATFMMLPQELPAGAKIKVYFQDDVTGTDRSVEASIGGRVWPEGKQVTYTLTVQPGFKFELSELPTIDAHYTIHKTTLKVSGVAAGKAWTVTAQLVDNTGKVVSDGEQVSIIEQQDTDETTPRDPKKMNAFAERGYWTDKFIAANGTESSARGEQEFSGSGSGDIPIALFIPENAGDLQRTIRLKIKFNGYTEEQVAVDPIELTQLCPAWTSNGFGWEQIDDNQSGEFGFCWDFRSMYLIPYGFGSQQRAAHTLLENLITQYSASYVSVYNKFMYTNSGVGSRITYIFIIDYSKLNELSGSFGNNGWNNTTLLEQAGAGAIGMTFENVLNFVEKTETGATGNLYRHPDAWEISNNDNKTINFNGYSEAGLYESRGEHAPGLGILNFAEKKNAFNLKAFVQNDNTMWIPVLNELKWYIPAQSQFNSLPTAINDAITPGECWTSSPVLSSSRAYLGDGGTDERLNPHKVRVCRNR